MLILNESEIAEKLMTAILLDNDFINRFEPENISESWKSKIEPICKRFFSLNPEYLTEEHIDNICCGCESDNEVLYDNLEGYKELDDILGDFFNDDCGILK